MSKPTLADLMAQSRTAIPMPMRDAIMSSAAGWPRRIPLVDNSGFLITMIPRSHILYTELERNVRLRGYGQWFAVHHSMPLPSPAEYPVNARIDISEEHYYSYDFKVLQIGHPTMDCPTVNVLAIICNFREALLEDRTLPDLRDRFR